MGSCTIERCVFTGLPAEHYPSGRDSLEYIIEYKKVRTLITLTWKAVDWVANPPTVLKENRHIFAALILTGQWLPQGEEVDESVLTQILESKKYPRTREEKRFGLLSFLNKQANEDGKFVDLSKTQFYRHEWMKLFFKSREELTFHARALHEEGLIKGVFAETGLKLLAGYQMTFEGMSIAESGLYGSLAKNDKCFIAMSFSPDMADVREVYRETLESVRLVPFIVDEKIISGDRTINQEILDGLRKCSLCIADFTQQKNGVYFEAGYALGLGREVIYCCNKEDLGNLHFDTRAFQQVVYDSPEDLKKKLKKRLEKIRIQ